MKTHDTGIIEFRKWVSITEINKVLSKYIHRAQHFETYDQALAFLTSLRLGLNTDKTWIGWEPVKLIRSTYTPGEKETVTTYNLEGSSGKQTSE